MIPFFGIKRQYLELRDEMLDAADAVYLSGTVLDLSLIHISEPTRPY